MKYNVQISVDPTSGVDTAALSGVLTYLLENSVKGVPGVSQVRVESFVVDELESQPPASEPPASEPPASEPPLVDPVTDDPTE